MILPNLRAASAEDFERIYALLESSFPTDEYRPREAQKALQLHDHYRGYVAHSPENDFLIAFISLWEFPGFAFIEHFAVDPAYRNRGLGCLMLQQIMETTNGLLCLEAEPPETEIARRRISFYQRCGLFVNEYAYIQPSYSPDQDPVPLVFLTSGGPVSFEQFIVMRDQIYREVYGVTP